MWSSFRAVSNFVHSRVQGRKVATSPRKPRSLRLAVEMLEDRLTPSTTWDPAALGPATPQAAAPGSVSGPAPWLFAVSPNAGSAGSIVEILGANFTPGAEVLFGATPATLTGTQSDSILTAMVPAISVGVSDVTVINGDGQPVALAGAFYTLPSPVVDITPTVPALTLTWITPTSGLASGGSSIVIMGNGFESDSQVFFGNVLGQVTSSSQTMLTVTIPALAVGLTNITVTNPEGQQATLPSTFFAEPAAAPVITSVSPSTGTAPGTAVQILGSGFQAGAEVLIGGISATLVAQTDTSLAVTVPALAAGPADVTVINPDSQVAVLLSGFTVAAAPAPVVTSASFGVPDLTSGNVTLTITGTGFNAGSQVFVGGAPATINDGATDTTITVTLASRPTAGARDITVQNPDGQQSAFPGSLVSLPAAPPVIYAVSPNAGAANAEIQIYGMDFQPNVKVLLGGVAATLGDVVTSSILTVIVPTGLPTGLADVAIVNPDGQQVTLTGAFFVLASDFIIVPPSA